MFDWGGKECVDTRAINSKINTMEEKSNKICQWPNKSKERKEKKNQ